MGGTLARCSAEGMRTVVVTCTRGDLGTVFEPGLFGQDVATLRASELECAAARLGVSRVVQLGFADSGIPVYDRPEAFSAIDPEDASTRLLRVLEAERPSVVVAYDETGGYPHPDHVRAHAIAVAAYRRFLSMGATARLYFVRFPITWSREFVRVLRGHGIDAPGSAPAGADAGPDVVEIGVPDELAPIAFDVSGFVSNKLAALSCHASQFPPDHFLRRMPPDVARRLWATEFFSLECAPRGDHDCAH